MRVTVDIDEATLAEVLVITGEKQKSPAVAKAVVQFVKRAKAREFATRLREKAFDYPLSNEQIEGVDS